MFCAGNFFQAVPVLTVMYLVTTNPIVSMRSKVILDMRTNAIPWNPMEAFVFLAANEDYNVYSFDVRLVLQ